MKTVYVAPRSVSKTPARPRTKKYFERQEAILRIAPRVLNRKGVRGATMGDIADHFGLASTAVAYYFSSKEDLAAECFLRSIETYDRLIADASVGATAPERLARLLRGHFELRRRIAHGELDEIAKFDDVRALGDERVISAYEGMFRRLRGLIDGGAARALSRPALNARVHFLMAQLLWLEFWLPKYDPEDYPRAAERACDILLNGLGDRARSWGPRRIVIPWPAPVGADETREVFLRAATQLINEQGYHGASVERISARLDLTKGSFYHHIDAKDDLIAICFARTIEVVRQTQRQADQLPLDSYDRLTSALTSLVEHQLHGDAPLLRAATASVPEAIRQSIHMEFERNAVHFGSMVSDGGIDGSIRPVDVQIAAEIITATVNGAAELAFWLPDPLGETATEDFVRPLFDGLLS